MRRELPSTYLVTYARENLTVSTTVIEQNKRDAIAKAIETVLDTNIIPEAWQKDVKKYLTVTRLYKNQTKRWGEEQWAEILTTREL